MKRIVFLSAVIGAAAFLAGCQTTTQTRVPEVPKATALPTTVPQPNDELKAIESEFEQLNKEQDFPEFTDKDLQ